MYGALSIPFLLVDLLATVSLLPAGTSVVIVDVVPVFVLGFGLIYILASEARKTEESVVLRGHQAEALQRTWIQCGLSKREIEVANLVLAGCSNQQIALRLSISDSTVKKHMNHIFAKLKVGSRWELLRFLGDDPSTESTF